MITGLLKKPPQMPTGDESEDQPAQNMEQVLKKKREKLATDKLGIGPEEDTSV